MVESAILAEDDGMVTALLLDLGGTMSRSPVEMMAVFAEREPAARSVLCRRGPLGTEPDEHWERMLGREITEPEYLELRTAEVAGVLGRQLSLREFMGMLFADPKEFLRPEALALLADVRAAGVTVGALTNDLATFGGPQARSQIPFDVVVDGSVTGLLKPDPRAYAVAARELGRPPSEIVFLDDLRWNVEGAQAAGMIGFHVDVTVPGLAFAAARAALGIGG